MTNYLHRFDTVGAFIDEANRPTPNGRLAQSSRKEGKSPDWDFNTDFNRASKLAHDGWDEHVSEIQLVADRIKSDLQPYMVETFDQSFSRFGPSMSIGRYVTGNPNCFTRMRPTKIAKPGRIITVLVQGSVACAVDAKNLVKRGTAIAGLCASLEYLKQGVEVWLEISHHSVNQGRCMNAEDGMSNHAKCLTQSILVRVKSADDRLDISRLMFAVAHPACFRRLGFAVMENCETSHEYQSFANSSYGTASRPLLHGDDLNANILLSQLGWDSPEVRDGENWVRSVLSEYGLMVG